MFRHVTHTGIWQEPRCLTIEIWSTMCKHKMEDIRYSGTPTEYNSDKLLYNQFWQEATFIWYPIKCHWDQEHIISPGSCLPSELCTCLQKIKHYICQQLHKSLISWLLPMLHPWPQSYWISSELWNAGWFLAFCTLTGLLIYILRYSMRGDKMESFSVFGAFIGLLTCMSSLMLISWTLK